MKLPLYMPISTSAGTHTRNSKQLAGVSDSNENMVKTKKKIAPWPRLSHDRNGVKKLLFFFIHRRRIGSNVRAAILISCWKSGHLKSNFR